MKSGVVAIAMTDLVAGIFEMPAVGLRALAASRCRKTDFPAALSARSDRGRGDLAVSHCNIRLDLCQSEKRSIRQQDVRRRKLRLR